MGRLIAKRPPKSLPASALPAFSATGPELILHCCSLLPLLLALLKLNLLLPPAPPLLRPPPATPCPLQAASAVASLLEQLLLYRVRADHVPLHLRHCCQRKIVSFSLPPATIHEANLMHCIASNLTEVYVMYGREPMDGWTGSGHYLGAGGVHAEVVEAADDALLDVEP